MTKHIFRRRKVASKLSKSTFHWNNFKTLCFFLFFYKIIARSKHRWHSEKKRLNICAYRIFEVRSNKKQKNRVVWNVNKRNSEFIVLATHSFSVFFVYGFFSVRSLSGGPGRVCIFPSLRSLFRRRNGKSIEFEKNHVFNSTCIHFES